MNDVPDFSTRATGQLAARMVLALGFVLLGVWTIKSFLPALAWAGVFAIALWPAYMRAQRGRAQHGILLPLVFTVVVTLVFVLPVAAVITEIANEAQGVAAWIGDAQAHGIPVPDFVGNLPIGSDQATTWWQQNLSHAHPGAGMFDRINRGSLMMFSRQLAAELGRRVTLFFFMLLTLFVLLREGHGLTAQLRTASRRAFGDTGERVGVQIIASVHGTVSGLVLVGLAEGAVLGVAYAIAGVPHPALMGVASGIVAILPFGAYFAVLAAALLLLATGGAVAAVILLGFGVVLAFTTDHFVRPVLIGGATRLPFLWVLLGILGGLEVWGLLGLFLGPAILSALILLWRDWVRAPGHVL